MKDLTFITVVQKRIKNKFYTLQTVNQLISDRNNVKNWDVAHTTITKDLDEIYNGL